MAGEVTLAAAGEAARMRGYGLSKLKSGRLGSRQGDRLTLREREVLVAVILFGRRAAAAKALGISLPTVKNHLTTIYIKTDSVNVAQALHKLGHVDLLEVYDG